MLLELDSSNDAIRKYAWGLDLAGLMGSAGVSPAGSSGAAGGAVSLDAAGGIGGLIGVLDAASGARYAVFYDANGNVGQLVDQADGSLAATYEYDAYGDVVAQSGSYTTANPFRFSTKYWDGETELNQHNYRYYSPRFGRFLTRDPMDDLGGILVQPVGDAAHFIPRDVLHGDGPNAYTYTRNRVAHRVDPIGAQSVTTQPGGNDGSNSGSPWLSKCQSSGWAPRTSAQCNYGAAVLFEADFIMREDPYHARGKPCSGQCTPHIMLRNGGSGPCTARVNWPLDCVCSHMPNGELSNCVRGCLRCIYDNKGSAADLTEHTWCIQQCRTGGFWWWQEYSLYQKLDAAIHCCAKKQGIVVGLGIGSKPGPAGPKPAQKIDCCGCGPGTQRPLDCSGY